MSVFGVTLKETAHDITVRDSKGRPLTIPPELTEHIDRLTNDEEAKMWLDGNDEEERLASAASRGSLRLVKHFIKKGTHITEEVIAAACQHGNRPVIEYLLNAALEASRRGDRTLIDSENVHEAVRPLVDIQVRKRENGTYVLEYDIEFLTLILPFVGRNFFPSRGLNIPHIIDESVMRACENGNVELMEVILENTDCTQDVLAKMFDYAFRWNLEVPRLLLDHGLDINYRSQDGRALFDNAFCTFGGGPSRNPEENKFKFMVQNGVDVTADQQLFFNHAIMKGYVDVARAMIGRGARVNGYNDDGKALASACRSGRVDMMHLLIEQGAVPTAGDNIALLEAARCKTLDPLRLLLSYPGVNVRARNDAPLIAAVAYSDDETNARLLLERGADANARGGLPLLIACNRRTVSSVAELLNRGAKSMEIDVLATCTSDYIEKFRFLTQSIQDRIRDELSRDLAGREYISYIQNPSSENAKAIVEMLLRAGAQPTWFLMREFAISQKFDDVAALFAQ